VLGRDLGVRATRRDSESGRAFYGTDVMAARGSGAAGEQAEPPGPAGLVSPACGWVVGMLVKSVRACALVVGHCGKVGVSREWCGMDKTRGSARGSAPRVSLLAVWGLGRATEAVRMDRGVSVVCRGRDSGVWVECPRGARAQHGPRFVRSVCSGGDSGVGAVGVEPARWSAYALTTPALPSPALPMSVLPTLALSTPALPTPALPKGSKAYHGILRYRVSLYLVISHTEIPGEPLSRYLVYRDTG
jgi:hypothetical protein